MRGGSYTGNLREAVHEGLIQFQERTREWFAGEYLRRGVRGPDAIELVRRDIDPLLEASRRVFYGLVVTEGALHAHSTRLDALASACLPLSSKGVPVFPCSYDDSNLATAFQSQWLAVGGKGEQCIPILRTGLVGSSPPSYPGQSEDALVDRWLNVMRNAPGVVNARIPGGVALAHDPSTDPVSFRNLLDSVALKAKLVSRGEASERYPWVYSDTERAFRVLLFDFPSQLRSALTQLGHRPFQNLLFLAAGTNRWEESELMRVAPLAIWVGDSHFPGSPPEWMGQWPMTPWVTSEGPVSSGLEAVEGVVQTFAFARAINVHERSSHVSRMVVLRSLHAVRQGVEHRVARAWDELQRCLPTSAPYVTQLSPGEAFPLLDRFSGAVQFDPYVVEPWWEARRMGGSAHIHGPLLLRLTNYFLARAARSSEEDRPGWHRILYTPRRVLLRGERYYWNLRIQPVVEKFEVIAKECEEALELLRAIAAAGSSAFCADLAIWKHVVALADQLRNGALVLLSAALSCRFDHALQELMGEGDQQRWRREEMPSRLLGTMGTLANCVELYYDLILQHFDSFDTRMQDIYEADWPATRETLELLRGFVSQLEGMDGDLARHSFLGRIVRKWREADHPGENLLLGAAICSHLEKAGSPRSIDAIGIGWGGVELPIVLRVLGRYYPWKGHRPAVSTWMARYAHYSTRLGSRDGPTLVTLHSDSDDPAEAVARLGVVMDDNVLTGQTLQAVRDRLLLLGYNDVKLFVVRYSGERRYGQMRMKGHGTLDPRLLPNDIMGCLGETPFARSWSQVDYENPIGVFSLSRRRILEALHNNASTLLYEREGF